MLDSGNMNQSTAPPFEGRKKTAEGNTGMYTDKPFDDLIRAGWEVIESDYHTVAFQNWRQKAFDCLVELMGPDHMYTQYFENHIRQSKTQDLLAGTGILSAAKEEVTRSKHDREASGDN